MGARWAPIACLPLTPPPPPPQPTHPPPSPTPARAAVISHLNHFFHFAGVSDDPKLVPAIGRGDLISTILAGDCGGGALLARLVDWEYARRVGADIPEDERWGVLCGIVNNYQARMRLLRPPPSPGRGV